MALPPQYSDEPGHGHHATHHKDKGKKNKNGYGAAGADEQAEPLLASTSAQSAAIHNWAGDVEEGDVPDGYKVGVVAADCDELVRLAFIRKVYSILFLQILATAVVSVVMALPGPVEFMQDNSWIILIPMFGSFISMGLVFWKRHQHPANLVLLGIFTLFEAMLVGTIVSYYSSTIVLQALFITLGIFGGLTLFTFQTKYDFSSFGPFLFAGLVGILITSFVQIFLPFSSNVDLAIACFSVVLFSGYILYDTQNILKRYNVDEYIMAVLALYMDIIQLFLNILRVLNNAENR